MEQGNFVSCKAAFKCLKDARHHLTKQQYYTLRGQIMDNNPVGALKGLKKILDKKSLIKGDEKQ